jgi:ATP-dependent Clp protease ATP-binding subunit ClpX
MFDLPSLEGVEEVVISKEVVEGTARPLYIYATRAGDAVRARRRASLAARRRGAAPDGRVATAMAAGS